MLAQHTDRHESVTPCQTSLAAYKLHAGNFISTAAAVGCKKSSLRPRPPPHVRGVQPYDFEVLFSMLLYIVNNIYSNTLYIILRLLLLRGSAYL